MSFHVYLDAVVIQHALHFNYQILFEIEQALFSEFVLVNKLGELLGYNFHQSLFCAMRFLINGSQIVQAVSRKELFDQHFLEISVMSTFILILHT